MFEVVKTFRKSPPRWSFGFIWTPPPGKNFIKLFCGRKFMNFCNKLESLSLASLSSLVYCLQARSELTQMKPLSGAPV